MESIIGLWKSEAINCGEIRRGGEEICWKIFRENMIGPEMMGGEAAC